MNNDDRTNLIRRVSELEGLTDREHSALLGLLREGKTYGLVWEDKPEAAESSCNRAATGCTPNCRLRIQQIR